MTKHVLSITYLPKIEPVKSGTCKQTIRKGRKMDVGDPLQIHGWENNEAYRAKWSWRVYAKITTNIPITVDHAGFTSKNINIPWNSKIADALAKEDRIDPPTGIALRDTLFSIYGPPIEPEDYQIIGWEWSNDHIPENSNNKNILNLK